MKKNLFSLSMLIIPAFANAAPNVWQSGGGQGIYENVISDAKGNSLLIQCDEGYTDDYDTQERKHSVTLTLKSGKVIDQPALVINGKMYYPFDGFGYIGTRAAENAWANLNDVLPKAKTIDAYDANGKQKLASFKPTKNSTKSVWATGCRI